MSRSDQNLMLAYMALGRRGAAIRQFEIYRSYLWAEMGLEPAPETVALYRWIQQELLPNLRDRLPDP